MASVAVSEVATHAATLRAELKEWERGFAAANGGRKADRSDIKKVPEIAAKYKEYSRLKALESSSTTKNDKDKSSHTNTDIAPESDGQYKKKRRKHSSPNEPDNTKQTTSTSTSTPRKTSKRPFETPSKSRIAISHPADVDPYDSPSVLRRLFSPSTHMHSSSPLKTAIGPTPQRDGKALGLFDLLSESGGSTATPTATRIASIKGMAAQTPSKRKRSTMDTIVEEDEEGNGEGEGEEETPPAKRTRARTPDSEGKSYMLEALFATPTTLRYSALVEGDSRGVSVPAVAGDDQAGDGETARTGNEESGAFETPAFLRRSTTGGYGAGVGGGLSPIAVRKRPQFVGKGLSELVQGLRDMEEERLEDELDVLREMEAEQAALNVDVPDSQNAADNVGRTFKKKGQKRTTRLVRMRPVVSRPAKPTPGSTMSQGDPDDDEGGEGSHDELVAIAETQQPPSDHTVINHDNGDNLLQGFDDDVDSLHTISEAELDSDPYYDAEEKPLTRSKSFSEKIKEAIGDVNAQSKVQEKEKEKAKQSQRPEKNKDKEVKKPSTRKINPNAHANYRSLKIRNRGTKGRGVGRFRRR